MRDALNGIKTSLCYFNKAVGFCYGLAPKFWTSSVAEVLARAGCDDGEGLMCLRSGRERCLKWYKNGTLNTMKKKQQQF